MDILALDQRLTLLLNGSASLYWDHVAWIATSTIVWFPVALVLCWVIVRSGNMRSILLFLLFLGLAILLADQVASGICKPLFARPRPARSLDIMYAIDVVNGYRGGQYGFFSSHAANTMAAATYLTLCIRHRALGWWLYAWALLNCWTRVYLGVHYVGDLLVGTLWGLCVGWSVYKLSRRFFPQLADYDARYAHRAGFTPTGYSVQSAWLIISGLAATYIFVLFCALFQ